MTSLSARVLFVCTANQCRSPLAEAMARHEADGVPVEFESAGITMGGFPMPPAGVRVAGELGLDLRPHLSRQFEPSRLVEFDLVLTAERAHARELVAEVPELWPRVFTIKQFSRWAQGRELPPDEGLRGWL